MAENENTLFRKSTLERVSSPDQLNDYIKVTNPSLIVILVGIFSILIAGFIWVVFGGIPQTVELSGVAATDYTGARKVYCFVPVASSKRLTEGMEVQVTPEHASRAEYGYIRGEIVSVGDDVITESYLAYKFPNPQLVIPAVNTAMQSGNVVEVEMVLKDWSTEKGNQLEVTDGLSCDISVVVGETKPYELMFNK